MSDYTFIEPFDSEDDIFISQVKEFVKENNVVWLGDDKTLLIDKYLIPIFDIREAKYDIVSEVQVNNAYRYLRQAPDMIKRLLNIIDKINKNNK